MNTQIHRNKSNQPRLRSSAILALVATLAFAATSGNASARERVRSGTATGPNGRSISTQSAVTAGGGNRSAVRSVEGPNGRGATHSVERSYNPATGTVSRDATTTTNSGASYSRDSTVNHSGTGTVSRSSTSTGPNGGQVSRQSSASVTHP